MDLTNDEVLTLGAYCDALMNDEHFNTLARLAEVSAFQAFANTAANDKDGRERAYAEFNGFRNFLEQMRALVEMRKELLEEPTPSSDDDA